MNNSVFVGKDGFLFLVGGNHKVLEYFTSKTLPKIQSFENFWSNIKEREAYCTEKGVAYKHFIFPDKLYALRDKTNFQVESLYKNKYEIKIKNAQENVIYFDFPIKKVENFYHKTDTHINVFGTASCVKQMIEDVSKKELNDFSNFIYKDQKTEEMTGDLGSKMNPIVSEIITSRPIIKNMFRYSNSISGGNNGMLDILINPNAVNDKRLLIFGDSFFRISLGFLSFFYKEVIFCRTPFFYPEIVSSCSPDTVFTGNAERYLSNVHSDILRRNFFLLPLLDEKKTSPSDGFGRIFKKMFDITKL